MPGMERNTQQRKAICTVFQDADRPLSPRQVARAAKALTPGVGLATVYRNIKGLLASGWLVAVQMPGEPPLYEMRGHEHHHYFRCRLCEQVFNIHACPGDLAPLIPRGFRLEDHWLVLAGVCASCGKSRGAGRKRR